MTSPAQEDLEHVNAVTSFIARKSGEERFYCFEKWRLGRTQRHFHFRVEVKATEGAFDRVKEAFGQVAQDEAEKLSIVQDIMFRSTDSLFRIIAPVGGQGGVTMSQFCPNCNSFLLDTCAPIVERTTIGKVFGRPKR